MKKAVQDFFEIEGLHKLTREDDSSIKMKRGLPVCQFEGDWMGTLVDPDKNLYKDLSRERGVLNCIY